MFFQPKWHLCEYLFYFFHTFTRYLHYRHILLSYWDFRSVHHVYLRGSESPIFLSVNLDFFIEYGWKITLGARFISYERITNLFEVRNDIREPPAWGILYGKLIALQLSWDKIHYVWLGGLKYPRSITVIGLLLLSWKNWPIECDHWSSVPC